MTADIGASREVIAFWRVPEVHDVELLHARFTDYAYDMHIHDRYVFGTITSGVERFAYRGASNVAVSGEIAVLNPDEVHDGAAGHARGWSYRMSYVVRLQRAAAQLRQGASIAETAHACGFADQSHLTRCFRRTFGVTPARLQGRIVQEPRRLIVYRRPLR